jgi:hypothetical protein
MKESQETQPKPEAGLPLGAAPCSAWINFKDENPDAEETVLMWFPGLGGTGERSPWVKCDKLRNCLVGLPAFWAHIISPNSQAQSSAGLNNATCSKSTHG